MTAPRKGLRQGLARALYEVAETGVAGVAKIDRMAEIVEEELQRAEAEFAAQVDAAEEGR